jgi:hypothetical protein
MIKLQTFLLISVLAFINPNICKAQTTINRDLFLVAVSFIPSTEEITQILEKCTNSDEECLSSWILKQDRFKLNIYAWLADDFLESVTDGEIMNGIVNSEQIVYGAINTDSYERVKLDYEGWKALKNAKQELIKNRLSYQKLIKLMLNNSRFEEINMGADNFVNKTFYLLLNRYPTDFEKLNGVRMIEGQAGVLFFKSGQGKNAYLDILVLNDSFVEYQLKYWHEKLTLKQLTVNQLSLYLSDLNKINCFSLDCILKLIITKNIIRK